MKNQKEITLLQTIKAQFGWPVDLFRYGFDGTKGRFLYPDGRISTILPSSVQRNVKQSLEKIDIARQYSSLFSLIPWIEAVYVTGSVASLDAELNDDIDLWVITQPKRLWLTRALDYVLFSLLGIRRLRVHLKDSDALKNLFCFNMYTTSDHLRLETENPSFAIQFADALPIYVRNISLLRSLILENVWIREYLPHWYEAAIRATEGIPPFMHKRSGPFKGLFLDFLEYVAGVFMLLKAKRKLYSSPNEIFVSMFTTWGTPRILAPYEETQSKSSKEGK